MSKKSFILLAVIGLLVICGGVFWGDNLYHAVNHMVVRRDISMVKIEKVAIVFIDVWATSPWRIEDYPDADAEMKMKVTAWESYFDNDIPLNMEEKLLPFLDFARQKHITIVFSSQVYELSPLVEQKKYDEPIINLGTDLDAYLKGKGISTILYAGYATNNCVLGRPTGIRAMSQLGYNVILVKDCSLPAPYQAVSYEDALNEIEKVGSITTSDEVMRLFGGK